MLSLISAGFSLIKDHLASHRHHMLEKTTNMIATLVISVPSSNSLFAAQGERVGQTIDWNNGPFTCTVLIFTDHKWKETRFEYITLTKPVIYLFDNYHNISSPQVISLNYFYDPLKLIDFWRERYAMNVKLIVNDSITQIYNVYWVHSRGNAQLIFIGTVSKRQSLQQYTRSGHLFLITKSIYNDPYQHDFTGTNIQKFPWQLVLSLILIPAITHRDEQFSIFISSNMSLYNLDLLVEDYYQHNKEQHYSDHHHHHHHILTSPLQQELQSTLIPKLIFYYWEQQRTCQVYLNSYYLPSFVASNHHQQSRNYEMLSSNNNDDGEEEEEEDEDVDYDSMPLLKTNEVSVQEMYTIFSLSPTLYQSLIDNYYHQATLHHHHHHHHHHPDPDQELKGNHNRDNDDDLSITSELIEPIISMVFNQLEVNTFYIPMNNQSLLSQLESFILEQTINWTQQFNLTSSFSPDHRNHDQHLHQEYEHLLQQPEQQVSTIQWEVTNSYAYREYHQGAIIRWHVDPVDTHVLTAIIHIAHGNYDNPQSCSILPNENNESNENNNDNDDSNNQTHYCIDNHNNDNNDNNKDNNATNSWKLQIPKYLTGRLQDLSKQTNSPNGDDHHLQSFILQPGEVLLLQSAKLPHARLEALSSDYYTNAFVHLRPKDPKDWIDDDDIVQRLIP
jgi:hypothetical protein